MSTANDGYFPIEPDDIFCVCSACKQPFIKNQRVKKRDDWTLRGTIARIVKHTIHTMDVLCITIDLDDKTTAAWPAKDVVHLGDSW